MKEFRAGKQFIIWRKLRSTGLLIDEEEEYTRCVLTEEKLDDIGARLEHTIANPWHV
jgi:hypothetical protein